MKGRRLVLVGVGVLAALVLLLGELARRTRPAAQALVAAADFQSAVAAGDCNRAFGLLAAAYRAEVSRARFEPLCQDTRTAVRGTDYRCELARSDEPELEVSCAAQRENRTVARLDYTLVREDSRWRLRRFRMMRPPR